MTDSMIHTVLRWGLGQRITDRPQLTHNADTVHRAYIELVAVVLMIFTLCTHRNDRNNIISQLLCTVHAIHHT